MPLPCPSVNELSTLLAEQLDPVRREAVEAHLEGCVACQRSVERLLAAEPVAARPSPPAVSVLASDFLARLRGFPPVAQEGRATDAESTQSASVGPPTPAATPAPTTVGPYTILQKIGDGGMGVVYRARHGALRRDVALKMIHARRAGQETYLVRFRREAEIIARLSHPNFVQIYEIGEHEGQPYLAMEYVDGGNLADYLRHEPQSPALAATFVETLARAVHHAHERGILHRDLKPANILLGIADCRLQIADLPRAEAAPGQSVSCNLQSAIPRIADFGLARYLDDEDGLTRTGMVAGTPTHLAPEQIQPRFGPLGPGCDIYALGVVLYEMLVGRPPLVGAGGSETLHLVTEIEALPPSHARPDVPRDLDTICLKCLQKEPVRRYASALALADDLRRFLEGRPVLARPVRWPDRAWRWCRRNRVTAGLAATLTIVVLVTLAVVLGRSLRDLRHRERVAGEVRQALAAANTLRGSGDLAGARAELRRVEGMFTVGEIEEEVRELLQHEVAELASDERDLALAHDLEQLRYTLAASGSGTAEVANPLYERLFRTHGLDSAAFLAGARPRVPPDARLAVALAAGLDHWAHYRRRSSADDAGWRHLHEIAGLLDPEPFRQRVRAAVADMAALRILADEADRLLDAENEAPSPTTLVLLTLNLRGPDGARARGLARRAVQRHPGDFALNFALGWLLAREDGVRPVWDEATRYFWAATVLRPHYATAWMSLGGALRQRGSPEEAAVVLRRAIALQPDLAKAHSNLGIVLRDLGKPDEAIAAFHQAIRCDPTDADFHYNLGNAHDAKGEAKAAEDAYRSALHLNPRAINAMTNLAHLLRGAGRTEEALDLYREALRLQPEEPSRRLNLGAALTMAGQLDPALDVFRELTRQAPTFATGHYNLGLVLVKAGHPAEALAALQRTATLRPELRYNCAKALVKSACATETAEALRGQVRSQLLRWMHEELDRLRRQAETGGAAGTARQVTEWLREAGWAPLRDEAGLASLPEAERDAWRRFWREAAEVQRVVAAPGR